MKNFCVATDSGCDLPLSKCEEKDIYTLKLEYRFGDELVIDSMLHEDCHNFYERMRSGEVPKTSQVNIMQFVDFWKTLAPMGLPIVHICLGSGVSGTYSNGLLAIDIFHEDYPDIPVFSCRFHPLFRRLRRFGYDCSRYAGRRQKPSGMRRLSEQEKSADAAILYY